MKFIKHLRSYLPVKKKVLEKIPDVKKFKKQKGGKNAKKD